MCGIAGILRIRATGPALPEETIEAMTDTLRHRGPDGGATWTDPQRRIALGHRRLKIVDLSATGDQPMHSARGRWTIVFNGEIYNHRDIRNQLEELGAAPRWRGHSDTETLLAAVEHWGVKAALQRFIGMFAIALWDHAEATLTLARDRIGEKPLYVARSADSVAFASELKALLHVDGFDRSIDHDALGLFLWFGYVPAPQSIYRGARKLAPGTILTIDASGNAQEEPYWTLDEALRASRFAGSAEDAADMVEHLLVNAVRHQAVADVPVGAFLSGGIDSSTVVALLAQGGTPLKTFSLGFEDAANDETPYARAVAKHFSTDHTDAIMTVADASALLPALAGVWDEPFGDSSQLPSVLLSRLARQQVTVSLTGDGGDELFCGYDSYRSQPARTNRLLLAGLKAAAMIAPGASPIAQRLRAAAQRRSLSDEERHLAMMTGWPAAPALTHVSAITPRALARSQTVPAVGAATGGAAIDLRTYLVDDLLVKVDRAGMATSLETRMPLLDHRLVEFAFRLPDRIKLHEGRSKWPLRRILVRHLPPALIDRPKHGFTVPLASWLRGPLRPWAEDLLTPAMLARDGLVDVTLVRSLWSEHLAGRHDHSARLWKVLMLQAWCAR